MTKPHRFRTRAALPLTLIALLSAARAMACAECPLSTRSFPAGGPVLRFVVADFTHDGIPDVVVCEPDGPQGVGGVRLLAGAHAAADTGYVLGAPQAIASGDFEDVGAGDFDSDGIPDLALVDGAGHALRLLRSLGGGVFSSGPSYPLPDDAVTVTVADVDLDGILDLTVSPRSSSSTLLFSGRGTGTTGNGTFVERLGPGDRSRPVSVAYGDLDHDGILDAVVESDRDSTVAIFRGLSTGGRWNGTWGPASTLKLVDTPTYVRVADLDGDGNADILACTYNGNGRILYGDGKGADAAHVTDWGHQFHGKAPFGLADFRRDGRRAFVIADPGEFFNIVDTPGLRGGSGGEGEEYCQYGTTGHPVAAEAADLDGDGFDDMLAVSQTAEQVTVQLQRCASLAPFAVPGAGWSPDGVALSAGAGVKDAPVVCSDGAAGAYVAWAGHGVGTSHIFTQHVRFDGVVDPAWTEGGIALLPRPSLALDPSIVADGARGAFVVWSEDPTGTSPGIYGANVLFDGHVPTGWRGDSPLADGVAGLFASADASGRSFQIAWPQIGTENLLGSRIVANGQDAPCCGTQGHTISTLTGAKVNAQVLTDAAGSVWYVWQQRNAPAGDDIWVSHFRRDGSLPAGWPAGGVRVCGATGLQARPGAALAPGGGLFVAWEDARGGTPLIYANAVDSSANVSVTDGWALSTRALAQVEVRLVALGDGSALAAWQDAENGGDLWTQRLIVGGVAPGEPATGRALCAAPGAQRALRLLADGVGGAFACWQDVRGTDSDVYMQRLAPNGRPVAGAPANGAPVCTAAGDQTAPALALAAPGVAIVAWSDARTGIPQPRVARLTLPGATTGIPAQRPGAFSIERLSPNPAAGAFRVAFTLPVSGAVRLELFDLAGRRMLRREAGTLAAGRHELALAAPFAPGVYVVRLTSGAEIRAGRIALAR